MKNRSKDALCDVKTRLESPFRRLFFVALSLCLLFGALGPEEVLAEWPHVAYSKDTTPISYDVCGSGEPTLVFIHGWSCDARYWKAQVPVFSKKHRVVTLDLAGHGHSGGTRSRYTMKAFGEDVEAVARAVGSERTVLIGHSMGGSVIAEAARLMPKCVIGLIGIDTLENVEYRMTDEELDKMVAPLESDFQAGSRAFVESMFSPRTAPELREWVLADMSAAPSRVALSAMRELISQYITGEAAEVFHDIRAPVVVVKGDLLWPVDPEANRRHMASFDVLVLKDADHFLMMARPDEFNPLLEKAIRMILEKTGNPP